MVTRKPTDTELIYLDHPSDRRGRPPSAQRMAIMKMRPDEELVVFHGYLHCEKRTDGLACGVINIIRDLKARRGRAFQTAHLPDGDVVIRRLS